MSTKARGNQAGNLTKTRAPGAAETSNGTGGKHEEEPKPPRILGYEDHTDVLDATSTGEWQGECPFCVKPGHFYVNTEGKKELGEVWCCHAGDCGETGNWNQFLEKISALNHADLLEATDPGKANRWFIG